MSTEIEVNNCLLYDMTYSTVDKNVLLSLLYEVMLNLRTFSQILATVFKYYIKCSILHFNVYKFSECGMKIIKHWLNIKQRKMNKQNCCYKSLESHQFTCWKNETANHANFMQHMLILYSSCYLAL